MNAAGKLFVDAVIFGSSGLVLTALYCSVVLKTKPSALDETGPREVMPPARCSDKSVKFQAMKAHYSATR